MKIPYMPWNWRLRCVMSFKKYVCVSTVSTCPLRQHSTTEYLPGMIHTDSPTGLLPKFPSWALVCLGKSTLYNHTQGENYYLYNKLDAICKITWYIPSLSHLTKQRQQTKQKTFSFKNDYFIYIVSNLFLSLRPTIYL